MKLKVLDTTLINTWFGPRVRKLTATCTTEYLKMAPLLRFRSVSTRSEVNKPSSRTLHKRRPAAKPLQVEVSNSNALAAVRSILVTRTSRSISSPAMTLRQQTGSIGRMRTKVISFSAPPVRVRPLDGCCALTQSMVAVMSSVVCANLTRLMEQQQSRSTWTRTPKVLHRMILTTALYLRIALR